MNSVLKETWVNLAISYKIHHQSFTCQLLIATELAIEAGLKFAKVYFTNCKLACNCSNFSPPKVSLNMASEQAKINDIHPKTSLL